MPDYSSVESIFGGKDYSIFDKELGIPAVPTPLSDQNIAQNIAPDPLSSIESNI